MLENLKLSERDVQDLRELIPLTILKDEEFGKFVNIKTNVRHGDQLGFIGEMSALGKSGAGCNPEYGKLSIENSEKRWSLGDWEIAKEICYKELEGTIAELAFKTGTDIADLTSTQFATVILEPALETAVRKMIWRIGWFNDKSAANVSDGGVITDGVDVAMMNVEDGLWKRIFTQVSANAEQRTEIAANGQASAAAQKSALWTKGVATDLVDKVLADADARISENGGILMMTRGMANALANDIKKVYNTQLQWETIFDGFDVTEYDGVQVARIGVWDEMIRTYENNGTKLNLPYRIVYGNPQNFLVGTGGSAIFDKFDIWFDRKARTNNIYATGKMGTLIAEETLFHVAY